MLYLTVHGGGTPLAWDEKWFHPRKIRHRHRKWSFPIWVIYSHKHLPIWCPFNTLRPIWNGRYFADDISKCIFVNENSRIPIRISLKLVPKGLINNIPILVQIMAWRRPHDKPLSEPINVSLPTHICVTQWIDFNRNCIHYKVSDEITYPFQPLKFGDEEVISSCPLLGMWLYIHAEIKINPC